MTLHNQALLNMDTKPSEGFQKLAFLLQQPSFPPVTFANLLLLYCKYEVRLLPLLCTVGGSTEVADNLVNSQFRDHSRFEQMAFI